MVTFDRQLKSHEAVSMGGASIVRSLAPTLVCSVLQCDAFSHALIH